METDIKRRMNEQAPGTIDDATPLWQFVRDKIMKDIAAIVVDPV
jgi:hypothetical protein